MSQKRTKGMLIYCNGWVIIKIVDYTILYLKKNQHLFCTLSERGVLKESCENIDNYGRPLTKIDFNCFFLRTYIFILQI